MNPNWLKRRLSVGLTFALFLIAIFFGQESRAATPNFGYLGYSWLSSSVFEIEFSPPLVSETIREYQVGAKYSLTACQANTVPVCQYSDYQILKTILPAETNLRGDITISGGNSGSRSYKGVRLAQLTVSELQKFMAGRTSDKDRSLVFSIRAVYGTTITEWSDPNFVPASNIWPSNKDSSSASQIKNYTIAFQGPLSGPEEIIGKDEFNAVKYAVTKFNEAYAGKIKVEVVEADDRGEPNVAREVAAKIAANQNVIAVVGPSYSGASFASFPSYKSANLAMISPSAIRDSLTDPNAQGGLYGGPVFHRIPSTDKAQGPALYRFAIEGVNSPKVFVIDDKSTSSQNLFNYMKSAFVPGHHVGSDSVADGTTDWTPSIAKLKSSGANVLIYLGYYPQTAVLVKQFRDSGYKGIIAASDGSYSPELFKLVSLSASEGLRVSVGTAGIADISTELANDFRKTIGSAPGLYAAESIDATNVILYCLTQNASSRLDMMKCIKNFKGESIYGDQFGFDSNGDNSAARFFGFTARNGEFQLSNSLNRPSLNISKWWPWYPGGSISTVTPEPSPEPVATAKPKPQKPSFSGVNFVGNKININVSLGGSGDAPDKVLLVAPKLGVTSENPLAGKIVGSNATWSLDFDQILSGTSIPLEVVSEKDGVKSESTSGSFLAPKLPEASKNPPEKPSNFKVRIVGNTAVLTAESTVQDVLDSEGFLFGSSLGLSKREAVKGEAVGTQFVFELPLKSSMAGKKYPLTIYLVNQNGESGPLNGTLTVPAAPKKVTPTIPSKSSKSETVICSRSSQTRTFAGTKCPPGWIKK